MILWWVLELLIELGCPISDCLWCRCLRITLLFYGPYLYFERWLVVRKEVHSAQYETTLLLFFQSLSWGYFLKPSFSPCLSLHFPCWQHIVLCICWSDTCKGGRHFLPFFFFSLPLLSLLGQSVAEYSNDYVVVMMKPTIHILN